MSCFPRVRGLISDMDRFLPNWRSQKLVAGTTLSCHGRCLQSGSTNGPWAGPRDPGGGLGAGRGSPPPRRLPPVVVLPTTLGRQKTPPRSRGQHARWFAQLAESVPFAGTGGLEVARRSVSRFHPPHVRTRGTIAPQSPVPRFVPPARRLMTCRPGRRG